MRTFAVRGALACLLMWTLASCADSDSPVTNIDDVVECSADSDCPGGYCQGGVCATDRPDASDDAGADMGRDSEEPPTDAGPDATPDMGPEVMVGDPCDVADDCPSGYCIETPGGQKVCSDFCSPNNSNCPEGFVCASLVNSGADRVFLCFPETDFLCDPCEVNGDCGGLSDLCLNYVDGSFCGRSCEVRECPPGYTCSDVETPNGVRAQCRNDKNYCSACFDPDEDGYGEGDQCDGADCNEEDASIHEGAPELCDGIDNNCNDQIDEGFDLQSDPRHCGSCENACAIEGATEACVEGTCAIGACDANRYDLDGLVDTGCEYRCTVSNEGMEACDQLDNDCDGQTDEDFDLSTDVAHCGACGNACSFERGEAACEAGTCVLAACDELYYDIDGDPSNGCEYLCLPTNGGVEACDNIDNDCDGEIDEDFDLGFDVEHCGRCGNVCPEPDNGRAACFNGACGVSECEGLFEDCNQDPSDGCEANLRAPATCLTCGNVCSFENGVPGCNEQGCFLAECAPGWVNADGNPDNGCEYQCTPTNGGVEACDEIDNDCDTLIDEGFDLNTDVTNCGVCGNACGTPDASTAICREGACVVDSCPEERMDCNLDYRDGCEVDLLNPETCGGCENNCVYDHAEAGCNEEGCFLLACDDLYYDIDGDPENGCEYQCSVTNGGVEACDNIDNDCDGRIDEEFNLGTDLAHCGACGNACPAVANAERVCEGGACVLEACGADYLDCNGAYADGCEAYRFSVDTCLACDNACRFENAVPGCNNQGCFLERCEGGWVNLNGNPEDGCEYQCSPTNGGVEACDNIDNDCDGQIDEDFDLDTDEENCGRCGRECGAPNNARAICAEGECAIDGCDADYLDCNDNFFDGCEASRLSPNTCLTCNTQCSFFNGVPGCNEQGCFLAECAPGWVNADNNPANGCELNCTLSNGGIEICDERDNDCDGQTDEDFALDSDVRNCGSCGTVCQVPNGQPVCVEGACDILRCAAGYADCDGQVANGCEVNLNTDLAHCGACGDVCATPNASPVCDAGSCEILRCSNGFDDCDGQVANGCESLLAVDVDHCGVCGNACDYNGGVGRCVSGQCELARCEDGFYDLDNNPANGCEYRCDFYFANNGVVFDTDEPDDGFMDANCDGIDGDLARAIFVSPVGNNNNSGLVASAPMRSLDQAIARANNNGRDQVLVASGNYTSGTTLELQSGVSLFGGYSLSFSGRSEARANFTSSASIAVRASGLNSQVTLDRLNLTATDRTGAGQASIALGLTNAGNHLYVRHSNVEAGRGGNGNGGGSGGNGAGGGRGGNASGSTGGSAGSGGGGGGGNGRRQASGLPGASGARNGSSFGGGGGSGGSGGLGCNDGNPTAGNNGGNGDTGDNGSHGARGNSLGSLSALSWSPSNGANGASGGRGGGGGGGGAGAGEDCEACVFGACACLYCGTGRGGGGGGGGGAGGGGGSAGSGGGASIGVVLHNSTMRIENVQISTAGGGSGGGGGQGGSGGSGGQGGSGVTTNDSEEGDGGDGGAGGRGGSGGCGGGGGGGPSIAVWGDGTAILERVGSSNAFSPGAGGAGGASCGNAGSTGTRSSVRSVTLR